ncbi:MAG: NUDIX domain-containing protein [Actinomycetota bacterium]
MKPFVHCPACASRLQDPNSEGGSRCPHCGRSWYRNSAPTVTAAIVDGDRVLVAIRAFDPKKGKADTPGGFLLPGEAPLDGLRREIREELGIEIDVSFDDFVQGVPHTYGDEEDWVLSLGFTARAKSVDLSPADDVADAVWVTYSELDDLDWAWPHDRELAKIALREKSNEHVTE